MGFITFVTVVKDFLNARKEQGFWKEMGEHTILSYYWLSTESDDMGGVSGSLAGNSNVSLI